MSRVATVSCWKQQRGRFLLNRRSFIHYLITLFRFSQPTRLLKTNIFPILVAFCYFASFWCIKKNKRSTLIVPQCLNYDPIIAQRRSSQSMCHILPLWHGRIFALNAGLLSTPEAVRGD